jgi:DNA mismatch repair ATPase MutL
MQEQQEQEHFHELEKKNTHTQTQTHTHTHTPTNHCSNNSKSDRMHNSSNINESNYEAQSNHKAQNNANFTTAISHLPISLYNVECWKGASSEFGCGKDALLNHEEVGSLSHVIQLFEETLGEELTYVRRTSGDPVLQLRDRQLQLKANRRLAERTLAHQQVEEAHVDKVEHTTEHLHEDHVEYVALIQETQHLTQDSGDLFARPTGHTLLPTRGGGQSVDRQRREEEQRTVHDSEEKQQDAIEN